MSAAEMKIPVNKLGYYIDRNKNICYMNKKFTELASDIRSDEFETAEFIREKFPNIKFITISGRQKKAPQKNKRVSYKNMREYIRTRENSDLLLAEMEKMIEASKVEASPYAYVNKWFTAKFPKYQIPEICEEKASSNLKKVAG